MTTPAHLRTTAHEDNPNGATWTMIQWVRDGMKMSEAMHCHLLPLIQARDTKTFEAEARELLIAWVSGQDLHTHPIAMFWLYHEVARGMAWDWLSEVVATLDWAPILGTSRQPSSLPESSDPLVNAAYHWAQWACHHQPSLSSAIDLRQLAYEMGSTWCLASASPRQQGPLSAFVHAIITASVETVQWTVVLDQLAQISLPAQTEA